MIIDFKTLKFIGAKEVGNGKYEYFTGKTWNQSAAMAQLYDTERGARSALSRADQRKEVGVSVVQIEFSLRDLPVNV